MDFLGDYIAEFGRGKDKKPRKKRQGLRGAAIVGGYGLGVGALAADQVVREAQGTPRMRRKLEAFKSNRKGFKAKPATLGNKARRVFAKNPRISAALLLGSAGAGLGYGVAKLSEREARKRGKG